MGKGKLHRFAENETFGCLVQTPVGSIIRYDAGGLPIIEDQALKGCWNGNMFHNGNPIVLELGCGKGEYTIELSRKYGERNFIGVDIKGARLWKGAKFATENNLPNVAFLRTRIEFITAFFAPDEVSEIWVTFADPQPKSPKKRLTHPDFLNRYKSFLKRGGLVHLKTDSRLLYDFTLETAPSAGFKVLAADPDIYSGDLADNLSEIREIKTFYEKRFLEEGLPITYVRLQYS
ncbi:MAG: tRNA (guanosine(46)-N7)-methyltransferase TrmB [Bacteroidales bacterium]|jgi:tRNA (guanine-N7-)-methyltransferase|nr:tRNA (guanosine(46)-N7)-methyltransferase TrmB [Bacteroidales bacterium]MCI2121106.1 tRNA (guanosine(46)-N7)-methyltransferase TrmB [Bacteroidales bacterium]MCI2144921.1 tRNA (guanosine(46)-N7)-methyltransferase TrmB [Bacteroidales bacterium]